MANNVYIATCPDCLVHFKGVSDQSKDAQEVAQEEMRQHKCAPVDQNKDPSHGNGTVR